MVGVLFSENFGPDKFKLRYFIFKEQKLEKAGIQIAKFMMIVFR